MWGITDAQAQAQAQAQAHSLYKWLIKPKHENNQSLFTFSRCNYARHCEGKCFFFFNLRSEILKVFFIIIKNMLIF